MSASAGDYPIDSNYYELLGVSQSATPQEIKQAYRTLARQYHPDVRSGDDDSHADEMLKRINAAYEVLSDPLKRARYDRAERQRWAPPNPYAVYDTTRTTGSYPAPSKAPFKLLFFAIGFVLVMSIIMTVIVLEFTPTPKAPKTVERFYGEQTETATVRRIAAINRMPTSTPAPEFLQRAWEPFHTGPTPQYALLPLACTLDLIENEHDCANTAPIQFVEVLADGRVLVKITLDPGLYGYTRLQFEVQYASDGPIEGWTVHISDSYSDDEANNAQVVVTHDNLLIFGQEDAPDNTLAPLLVENAVQEGDTLLLEIMDQRVAWSIRGEGQEVVSQYLFALGGQTTAQSNENSDEVLDYDLYASFNRAVQLDGSPAKIGQGVERVTIRLLSPMILTPTPASN